MANRRCMITTYDNPYNPFTDYTQWDLFDNLHGYYSSAYLARIAIVSPQLTEREYDSEIERAIDEIIRLDPFNRYTKVYEN